MRLLWRKLKFSLQVLSIGDCFWVRDGACVPLLLSALGPYQVQTCAATVHSALGSCSFVVDHITQRACSFIVLHTFWLLIFFLRPFLKGSLTYKGRDFNAKSHLKMSVPRGCILFRCRSLNLFLFATGE